MISTKQKILAWQAEIAEAKENEFRSVLEKKEKNSVEFTTLFKKIQKKEYKDDAEYQEINRRLEELSQTGKTLTASYDRQMKKRFKELYLTYPGIYDMFVNRTVDQSTLNHVLDTFDQVSNGRISSNEGISHGLDYMTDKYNLPSDFFNKDAIGKPRRQ